MAWVCCQLGAREQYAVPRALHRVSQLQALVTDIWAHPPALPNPLLKRLGGRYNAELAGVPVEHRTATALVQEAFQRTLRPSGWSAILARNQWFQQHAANALRRIVRKQIPQVVFSYSYTALNVLEVARRSGCKPVLGQIDPGPRHQEIVNRLESVGQQASPAAPPDEYWIRWRAECDLAEHIIVNSLWSADCLVQAGIQRSKIAILPLAYSGKTGLIAARTYPRRFTGERRMRILFLGQISRAKGALLLLEAFQLLQNEPVELQMVGRVAMPVPDWAEAHPHIRWTGPVPHADVEQYYCSADLFVFPTFSDGFGMTQLEASAWRLPIIATPYCGRVVEPGHNGLLLEEMNPACLAELLSTCLHAPDRLATFSAQASLPERYSLHSLARNLTELETPSLRHGSPQ